MTLGRPAAVFFDWDGTLVDSFEFLHGAHNHVRRLLGFEPFSLEVFGGYLGQPREKLYLELYGDKRDDAKLHFEAYVLENHLTGLKPTEGASALLHLLSRMQIPMGVVSNKKGSLIRQEIENFGWSGFFASIVGAAEAEADKPSPAPLFLALERAGLAKDMKNVWFVGDTDNDLVCARDAQALAVLIADEVCYEKLSREHDIDLHCNNCLRLHDFLLQYGSKPLKLGQDSA